MASLELSDDEAEALRRRAELESRSMQEVARQVVITVASGDLIGERDPDADGYLAARRVAVVCDQGAG